MSENNAHEELLARFELANENRMLELRLELARRYASMLLDESLAFERRLFRSAVTAAFLGVLVGALIVKLAGW